MLNLKSFNLTGNNYI